MMATHQSETNLKLLVDSREGIHRAHEAKLADINGRDNPMPTSDERDLLKRYRTELAEYDEQILDLSAAVEADMRAEEESRKIKRALAGGQNGIVEDGDGIVYTDFTTYAYDYFITRTNVSEAVKISRQWGVNEEDVQQAKQRLDLVKRTPANTLSSNVAGLTPAQHIADIFQVIDRSRPIVQSANRSGLERGQLTYPFVSQRPVVAVQNTEKTEAGNTGMIITMVTATASTYLGGGDLSWQAINWSTPSALRLWFDLVAADYALKTEQDAAQELQHSGFTYNISSTLAALTDFNDVLLAIAAGAGDVYTNSGRMADTIYMAPNAFFSLAGISGPDHANFVNSGTLSLGPQSGSLAGLRVVVSRGMDTGVIVVGDSQALLVAETPGAPVEMQVVEPAIGGVEVGLIGAFEAVVAEDEAFSLLSTAS
jgi:hypothetical protein